ncbi:hypothetical protein [Nocardia sp. NPDC051570]|uniref:hypothetical protein n=1 Tax=Nocardia sp. NPDC051570 TaxID=3364324 RepID=UPI00379C74E3
MIGDGVVAPLAGADPAAGQGTLTVQATTDDFGVSGVAVGVTTCAAGPVLATLTTAGREGTALQDFAPGCYQAQVTSVPTGCGLDSIAYVTVNVVAGGTAVAPFKFRCA